MRRKFAGLAIGIFFLGMATLSHAATISILQVDVAGVEHLRYDKISNDNHVTGGYSVDGTNETAFYYDGNSYQDIMVTNNPFVGLVWTALNNNNEYLAHDNNNNNFSSSPVQIGDVTYHPTQLNDNGLRWGSQTSNGSEEFFIHQDGSVEYIDTGLYITAMNNNGLMISNTGIYDNGQITYIDAPNLQPSFSGSINTFFSDINNNNEIVGFQYQFDDDNFVGQLGFIYKDGLFTVLENDLAEKLIPRGINDNGVIVGEFQSSEDGLYHSFISEPIATPIPGAIWLLISGLAGIVGIKRQQGNN